jgi:hypothetical protein
MQQTWSWVDGNTYPSFSLTFARDVTPAHLLESHGADLESVREFSEDESASARLHDSNLSILRAGTSTSTRWAFCFEILGSIGMAPNVLKKLSAGTESVTLSYGGDGIVTLTRCFDGVICESFEVKGRAQPYGTGPFVIHTALDEFNLDQPKYSPKLLALKFLTHHYGFKIDEATIQGELPTALLPQLTPLDRGSFSAPSIQRGTGEGVGSEITLPILRK